MGGVGGVVEILREKVGGKEREVIRNEGEGIPYSILHLILIL